MVCERAPLILPEGVAVDYYMIWHFSDTDTISVVSIPLPFWQADVEAALLSSRY